MLTDINPKLPMRNKQATLEYYKKMGFEKFGEMDYPGYLMIHMDKLQLHFFEYKELDSKENYGGVYIRTDNIEQLYESFLEKKIIIHPNGNLEKKPWGQKEFAVLDPDNNLLTFGQNI